jgi:hypothetical protein
MNQRAQGAIEYLLIIGAAILVVAIVTGIIIVAVGGSQQQSSYSTSSQQAGVDNLKKLSVNVNLYGQNISGTNPLTNNLVSAFNFNGSTVNSAPSAPDGKIVGGVTYADGRWGEKAAVFNGTDSRIEIPNYVNNTSFTISAWFNYSAVPNWGWIYATGPGWVMVGMALHPGADPSFFRYHSPCSYTTDGNHTASKNVWHNVTYVFDGQRYVGYLDGQIDSSVACSTAISDNSTHAIGAGLWDNSEYFQGEITGVGIWNRALSAQEVTQLYNMSK